ncbi:MAG: SDR family oxidoreductase [Candidatus Nanopelagicales bacterium]|nr:SDR family oxidoreductase [Candidatus Nanopelagicales bacterium]MDP4887614.1 SDR family oxidoreductase [Candidatus Nanopelagicales bacterium]
MATALITGATSGIGSAFAEELARQGHNIVLVARDTVALAKIAQQVRGQGVEAEILAADLADPDQLNAVAARLADAERPIDICVNNAGLGVREEFATSSVAEEQLMIDVMVTAVMRLSHAVLPVMLNRGTGAIINVSSIAGWLPGGTYSAAKAWTTVFSESLHAKVEPQGVHVIAVCPGYTRTQFHQRAGMNMSKVPSWMWLTPEQVVSEALKDARSGRVWSVAGRLYKGLGFAARVLPNAITRRVMAGR